MTTRTALPPEQLASYRPRPRLLRNDEPTAIGRNAEQWSCSRPGTSNSGTTGKRSRGASDDRYEALAAPASRLQASRHGKSMRHVMPAHPGPGNSQYYPDTDQQEAPTMAYGHAERNLAAICKLEAETRQLPGSMAQLDQEQSACLGNPSPTQPI